MQRKNVGRERMWAEEGAETVQRKGEDGGALLELSKYSANSKSKRFQTYCHRSRTQSISTLLHQCHAMPVVFLRRRPSLPQVRAGFVVPKPFQITEPVHHHKIQHTDKATTKKTKIQHQIEENKRKRRNSNKRRRRTVPAALPKCCLTFPAPSSGGTRGPRFVVPCH